MNTIKKRQWLEAEKICIAQGHANALNLMFEDKDDHQLFLQLWDKYLGQMTEVINYHLSPTGWTILFKTKHQFTIKNAYLRFRQNSKKANPKHTYTDVSRILSEHFRIFLSQYVRKRNIKLGRRGTLVLERFRKWILSDLVDYKKAFALLTSVKHEDPQKVTRFQTDQSQYDLRQEIDTGSIWKTGNSYIMGIVGVRKVLRCIVDKDHNLSVLRKFKQYLKNRIHPSPPT